MGRIQRGGDTHDMLRIQGETHNRTIDMLTLLVYCATDKIVYSATRVVYSATSQLLRERIQLRQADVLTYSFLLSPQVRHFNI